MIVLDTDVLSELMRPAPANAVADWIRSRGPTELWTTATTVAEIMYGVERLPAGERRLTFTESWRAVYASIEDRVLPFDSDAAHRYALLVADRERRGHRIDALDGQIAATCRAHGAVLATRNTRDFVSTGVQLVNPWDSSAE